MTNQTTPVKEEKFLTAFMQMNKAIKCLALELPGSVWNDVNDKWREFTESLPAASTPSSEQGSDGYWNKSFDGLKTEVTASKLLHGPHDDYKRGWNDAMDKAIRFIKSYKQKDGLFQIPYSTPPQSKE